MKIRKKLFITVLMSMIGISQMDAQSVKYRESQARLSEPVMGTYVKPLIADLEVINTSGIDLPLDFTMEEVDELGKNSANLKARVLFLACDTFKVDVIVAATFDIVSKPNNTGYRVRVKGYPARYKNWRTATSTDYEWIRIEKLTPVKDQKSEVATQAITSPNRQ